MSQNGRFGCVTCVMKIRSICQLRSGSLDNIPISLGIVSHRFLLLYRLLCWDSASTTPPQQDFPRSMHSLSSVFRNVCSSRAIHSLDAWNSLKQSLGWSYFRTKQRPKREKGLKWGCCPFSMPNVSIVTFAFWSTFSRLSGPNAGEVCTIRGFPAYTSFRLYLFYDEKIHLFIRNIFPFSSI